MSEIKLSLDDARQLKKDCENEIDRIIKSFQERTNIEVEEIQFKHKSGTGRYTEIKVDF